jgi:hypothetical protein
MSDCVLRHVASGLMLAVAPLIHAGTVWNGPLVTYNQPSPDSTPASNQDRITPDVWLTRASSKGLFNAFYETNATALSPTNTEWAFGTLANYASLNYTNWLGMLNGASPTTLVGQQLIVHLISDDIYISIQFTKWIPMGSGGFTYQRSTQPLILSGAGVNNGQFKFSYPAVAGLSYVVECSSNLMDWVPLVTNVASGGPVMFSNSFDPSGTQFYRVGQFQNP